MHKVHNLSEQQWFDWAAAIVDGDPFLAQAHADGRFDVASLMDDDGWKVITPKAALDRVKIALDY
jgi:hypothetical protein